MALSTYEIMMVLRARDEASRVLAGFGGTLAGLDKEARTAAAAQMQRGAALSAVGVSVAALGIAGVAALNNMTNAATEYTQQVSSTQTQTDKAQVSFKQLWDMGMQVGKDIPVAFKDIQPALYDIFSSIDTNAPGAATLLEGIGKAAVGGSTDMTTAGRAIIAILNAYKLKATDVSKVSDIMFQLVRKGVGTYEQFTEVIGRAVPSAIKAGQSLQSLAGMMAFLTRNGLSAANAATSSARALDALSNPKTQANFKDFGTVVKDAINEVGGPTAVAKLQAAGVNFDKMKVPLTDAKGNFRSVTDIMKDMNVALTGLTKPQKAAALTDLFKGSGGNIQAMRFFNLALSDTNGLLDDMTDSMNNAGGAAQDAYNIMANTPEAKIQLMNNRYQEMKITVGQQLIPVKLKLMEVLSKLLNMWLNLSPTVQKIIVKIIAFASVMAIIIGVILTVVGLFLMFDAALAGSTLAVGTIAVAIGIAIVAIAALGVAAFFIIKYWDQIKAASISTWNTVRDAVVSATDAVVAYVTTKWAQISAIAIQVWQDVYNAVAPVVKYIINDVVLAFVTVADFAEHEWSRLYNAIVPKTISLWHTIENSFSKIYTSISGAIGKIVDSVSKFGADLAPMGEALMHIFNAIKDVINFVSPVVKAFFKDTWNTGAAIIRDVVWPILKVFLDFLTTVFIVGIKLGISAIQTVFEGLAPIISAVFTAIGNILSIFIDIVRNTIMIFVDLINGDWSKALHAAWQVVKDTFDLIIAIFNGIGGIIAGILKGFVDMVVGWFKRLFDILVGHSIVPDMINAIVMWFVRLPQLVLGKVASFVTSVVAYFLNLGVRAIQAFASMIGSIVSWMSGLPAKIMRAVASLGGAMESWALRGMSLALQGLQAGAGSLIGYMIGIPGQIIGALGDVGSMLYNAGANIVHGLASGIRSAIGDAIGAIGSVAGAIKNHLPGSPVKTGPLKVLNNGYAGKQIVKMIAAGMMSEKVNLNSAFTNSVSPVVSSIQGGPDGFAGSYGNAGMTKQVDQKFYITTQEIDPIKHSADLGWEMGRIV